MQWQTHEVTNQVPELCDINLFTSNPALAAAVNYGKAHWYIPELIQLGKVLGNKEILGLAESANRHAPALSTHDRFGRRIDVVDFDASWHELLALLRRDRMQALPWMQPKPGAQVARAAAYFLHAQVESGSLCPITMTFASIPVLQKEPNLFASLEEKLFSNEHDPRDLPIAMKRSILIGMGMTEKQGGSDVRTNATVAKPISGSGRGAEYALTGHKWFFSAPMCDAHLVLARTDAGLSCFFVPRWRPDGSKNAILIQRLKDKLGNRSNSSSEVEFQDAYGVMIGMEGRGIQTIIEMANYTRLDCVIGSAALMRYALIQAMHHARHRAVFGKYLAEQPLMQNVLADLALESEAAILLMLRLAKAMESPEDTMEKAWRRILTPAAKFWVCKRALAFTGECMEVWGGNGYVENAPMARLYREAPVNSIWEGSGNIMCLDVLRAIQQEQEGFALLLEEFKQALTGQPVLINWLESLRTDLNAAPELREWSARRIAQRLVLLAQAYLMRLQAPEEIADSFIASIANTESGQVYGTLATHDFALRILSRTWPR
jgi:putative acyl-CoA dehydrogenase